MSRQIIMEVARRFASRQFGVVARRQLIRSGLAESTIAKCVENGSLSRLFRGVFAVGHPRVEQRGLWLAGVLSAGDGAVLGYRSAAALWGFLPAKRAVEVIRTGSSARQRAWVELTGRMVSIPLMIRQSRTLPAAELRVVNGIPVTSVARTLLDLSTVLSKAALRRAFIEADRLGLLDDRELVTCAHRSVPRRGTKEFRRMVGRRLPDAQKLKSVLEGLFLDLCDKYGIARPEVNHVVGRSEIDCVWPGSRTMVELDSYEFHRGREKFEEDRARSNRLKADGWVILRFTWRMVVHEPNQVAALIKQAQKRASELQASAETAP